MDDWTYLYPYPDVDVPDTQLSLLNQDGLAIEARLAHAQQAEATRVAELAQTHTFDAVRSPAEADVPLPFAAPADTSLAY